MENISSATKLPDIRQSHAEQSSYLSGMTKEKLTFFLLILASTLVKTEACFKRGEIVEGLCMMPNGVRRKMRPGETYSEHCEPTTEGTDFGKTSMAVPFNIIYGLMGIMGLLGLMLWVYHAHAETPRSQSKEPGVAPLIEMKPIKSSAHQFFQPAEHASEHAPLDTADCSSTTCQLGPNKPI